MYSIMKPFIIFKFTNNKISYYNENKLNDKIVIDNIISTRKDILFIFTKLTNIILFYNLK
jgi:hypothetical protein